mmetsp:Transcript_65943/g.157682  ORF Transcript_65943/g.157682 Transcript_65943/m.157682 type:complete len:300 (-) Transcript_65943:171-1070(-)
MDIEAQSPFVWDSFSSRELQQIVDKACETTQSRHRFAVTISDPTQDECPCVACSEGFEEMTGYFVRELVGSSRRFLLETVPEHLIDADVQMRCRHFLDNSSAMTSASEHLEQYFSSQRSDNSEGDVCDLCVQVNAKKSGELFRNAFHMMKVDLCGHDLIISLHADWSEEDEMDLVHCPEAQHMQEAFERLQSSLPTVETLLATRLATPVVRRRRDLSIVCGVGAHVQAHNTGKASVLLGSGASCSLGLNSPSFSSDFSVWGKKGRQITNSSQVSTHYASEGGFRSEYDVDDEEDADDLD